MLRRDSEPVNEQLLEQTRVGDRLASPPTRLAGLCTLMALVGWLYGGVWAADFISDRIVLSNASLYFGFLMEMQNHLPNERADATSPEAIDIQSIEDPVAEGLRLLEEQRRARPSMQQNPAADMRERRAAFQQQLEQLLTVQGAITIGWMVVMILTGAFMLCAGLGGLLGSHRSRKWHRLVVYWTFFATACTLGGMLALVQWGGFPPIPDPWILAKIAGVQSFYAIAIIVTLIATHQGPAAQPTPD